MGKILVPVDGSDFMDRVVSEASELAQNYMLDIILINVQPLWSYPSVYMSTEIREAEEERLRKISLKILNKAREMAKAYTRGVNIYVESSQGKPAEVIINYAETHNVDLIVIGYKGASDIKRFLLGDVASKVVAHAKQSVFVVK